jgi:hypothetical protein
MPPRTERIDDVLRAARALADPTSAVGSAARAAAADECLLSAAMIERVFATACARYTPEALAALASEARAGQRVGVALAATVATAPLRPIALPWLAGAERVTVRGSRRQPGLVRAFADAFARDEIAVVDELPPRLDALVAYGSDETIAALRHAWPEALFEGHGHGFGVSYVAADAPFDDAARAVAVDVAEHDQRGCLSPQTVFVAGDAVAFAQALHRALGAFEAIAPRGPVTAGDGAAVAQWQGVVAARGRWFRRGAAHGVGALDAAELMASPGLRNVAVCPVDSVAALREALGDELPHLTCVGVAGSLDAGPWRFTRARVVAAGTMQDPPLDGPEDWR